MTVLTKRLDPFRIISPINTFITTRIQTTPDMDGKGKSYLIYIYEKMTDHKQKDLCNLVGLSSRQYRDLRDANKDDFDDALWNEPFWTSNQNDIDWKWEDNIKSLLRFMDQLKLMGIEDVDEWGDYKPINDIIDKIVHAVRGCSGECTTNLDDWSSLKTFEWYLKLTDEDKIGYGIKT